MRTILILTPSLSQSVSCAKHLRAMADVMIIGGILNKENNGENIPYYYRKLYDDIVSVNDEDDISVLYDVVVPTGYHGTAWLLEKYDSIKCGDIEFDKNSLIVSDKIRFLDFAKSLNIPIPDTWNAFNDIPTINSPIFFKPSHEGRSGKRSWVSDPGKTPEYIKQGNYIYQEKIDSPGVYGYGFIAQDGKVLTSITHFEILSNPTDGGSASVIKTYKDKRIDELSEKIIEKMKYSGWGLVEFKYCQDRNDYVLMELNAKMWASIELAFRTNPDFLRLLFSVRNKQEAVKGLIWPWRLLNSGIIQVWRARKYIYDYDLIWEPIGVKGVASAFLPEKIKTMLKSIR